MIATAAQGSAATGGRAEALAERFLGTHGLNTVARNFRCRSGEIDLVMLDGVELVFVEVRYRARATPVTPALSVSPAKQRRLLRAAAVFLQARREYARHAVRFDVLAMTGTLERPDCEWIRCAFTADDAGGF